MQLLQWQPYTYLASAWAYFGNSGLSSRAFDVASLVNPLIGNGGITPDGSGGMIPSVAPPFGMTRWVAQTRENYVSVTSYNHTDNIIHGFQATHQPAIWMGESGTVIVSPGIGEIKPVFSDRGLKFSKENESISVDSYSVLLEDGMGGIIKSEMTATSRVGQLRFTFDPSRSPYIYVEATRASVRGHIPGNYTYPLGGVHINPSTREISGFNPERQDSIIAPISTPAKSFSGYFVARFDQEFDSYGTVQNQTLFPGNTDGEGALLGAFIKFSPSVSTVSMRVGVSFISIDQARRNLDQEIPDGQSIESTASATREAWNEKLGMIEIEGKGLTKENLTTFYTAFYHTLQYPYEQSEGGRYYSGYDDTVHEGVSYTGYSIWDTFRAEWAWEILFVPERIPGMVTSMLQDYKEGGWLPMWKNIIETNIMVGTHADVLVAEAVLKGFGDQFDTNLAYEAVRKDATVPPDGDSYIVYADREEGVNYEVRAGLSSVYEEKGWVADDIHSESASRTLDYAYDDHAVSKLAQYLNFTSDAEFFGARSISSYKSIFNPETGFMEARNASGAWAGQSQGWTEGNMWVYTFDVPQDVEGLAQLIGGNGSFVTFLDEHFDGGHNDHTNEPSHHVPYLYSLVGAASKTQERVREIAKSNYNETVDGLSGNEDCGQMSAWYLFSALGFYPVDPVSGEYVVGAPFFDKATLKLPGSSQPLVITAPGASTKQYVKSLTVNGILVDGARPVITHEQLMNGGNIEFEMSDVPEKWASGTLYEDNQKREEL